MWGRQLIPADRGEVVADPAMQGGRVELYVLDDAE